MVILFDCVDCFIVLVTMDTLVVPEETGDGHLTLDETIVAFYIMKICGLDAVCDSKDELFALLVLFKDKVSEQRHPGKGLDPQSMLCRNVTMEYFRQKANTTAAGYRSTPIVCHKCFKPGHIARGCKLYRCFGALRRVTFGWDAGTDPPNLQRIQDP